VQALIAWTGERMKRLLTAATSLFASQAHALTWQDSSSIDQLFSDAGETGTFVLYDVASQRLTGHDQRRAHTQFVPASTFKIVNTLIGLSTSAVKNVDEVLPYGGKPQFIEAWEKDMSLREAIAMSNIAIYQELARRIGLERMRKEISRFNYGNEEIGTVVDNFWLEGPLKISAVEQTLFLTQLAQETLPLPKNVQATVHQIIQLEQKDGFTLYGKTAWVNFPNPGVGWWVGWVKKGDRIYSFALNIDIQQAADADKRIALGKASLRALGVF
jgi:beta-lactamase class D